MALAFPPGLHMFERGWLSSNNILIVDGDHSVLIDSGYCTHAHQTLALVRSVLGDRPLDLLLNTHLHSDHCGGNAVLQAEYPGLTTRIPPGNAEEVARWDESVLTYAGTGQQCPRFSFQGLLIPGEVVVIGKQEWQIHGAGGHDPHSVVLYEPQSGVLISADALWEEGFGVVFPELEGVSAFAEVGMTLDLIESLRPELVIPGHGRAFTDVQKSLGIARGRLDFFVRHPAKHQQHAAKVLLKFKLLELQACSMAELLDWVGATPYLNRLQQEQYPQLTTPEMAELLVADLCRSGAATRAGNQIKNKG
ncbi:MAG: MBL fold metallo-hydrolase [Rhodoferax sp.]